MNRSFEAAGRDVAGAVEAGLSGTLLRGAGVVLVGSALVAVCAHVSVPLWFTPVPVTLQPFAVLLLGLLLSPRLAFATMVAYLAEGAAGLPVFTPHGLGGVAQLVGPTGGYLLSYPVVAPLISAMWRRGSRSLSRGMVIAGMGSLLTLAMGATWLGYWQRMMPGTLMSEAVLPFLPGDVLKVAAAAAMAWGAEKWKKQLGS